MAFSRISLGLIFWLMPFFLFSGCGDLEPEMQDTRSVVLKMNFNQRSSSRNSQISQAEVRSHKTHFILALPAWENFSSNYSNYYSSFAQELMNPSDNRISLEVPLKTQLKIFAFLFREDYTKPQLLSGVREVAYYGESQPFSIGTNTNNLSLGITLQSAGDDDGDDDGEDSTGNGDYENEGDDDDDNGDNEITGDPPSAGSWTDVGFWDFLNTGSNAVSGGSSWNLQNINFCCTTNITLNGDYGTEVAEVQTTLLDRDKFTLGIKANPSLHTKPIIVGGRSYRWLHIAVNNTGKLDLIFNNGATKRTTSQSVNVSQWHEIVINIDIENLKVDVYIDNNTKESLSLPAGFAWNFSTGVDNKLLLQNYSNGRAFAGQIDWIYAGNGLLTMDNVKYLFSQF